MPCRYGGRYPFLNTSTNLKTDTSCNGSLKEGSVGTTLFLCNTLLKYSQIGGGCVGLWKYVVSYKEYPDSCHANNLYKSMPVFSDTQHLAPFL